MTRADVVALWSRIVSAIQTLRASRDPEWLEGWARDVAGMRDNPCVRWPSPMPGWGWC